MDPNVEYITQNYVEWNDLLNLTGFTASEIENFITHQVIPNFSYQINTSVVIQSSLKDEHTITEQKKYFGKNVLNLLMNCKTQSISPQEYKTQFKTAFLTRLLSDPNKTYAYGNIFDSFNQLNQTQFEQAFEEEWTHYCNGIYGICTLQATPEDIVDKEIIIKRLIEFTSTKTGTLFDDELLQLKELNTQFNKVTRLFAPYQRQTSSRGKYLDTILANNNLDELIKQYSEK